MQQSNTSPERKTLPLIELRSIRKQYGGLNGSPTVEVLHGIDLHIYSGEFVAIVGASGSGKSTLMNILGCLDQPSSGQYLFQGENVAHLNADSLAWLRREAFGFVFQGYHLIPTETASENVQIPAMYAGLPETQRQAKADALLLRLGLLGKQHNRPNQLSGGQQQRVSIARALMNGGRIVLADEPTGALDSQSGKEVMALLHELADAGHTIILITHDKGVAAQARRVIEIHDGQITSDSAANASDYLHAPEPAAQHQPLAHAMGNTIARQALQGHNASWLTSLHEAARTAWRGMKLNRSRTMLTLLGIVIGVASVIVMLGIGEGAKQKVVQEMGVMGTNMMYIGSRTPPGGGPVGVLTPEDFEALEAVDGITHVMPVLRDPVLMRFGAHSMATEALGTGALLPQIHRWPVAQGRYFTERENLQIAPVVVLGHEVYTSLFPDGGNPLGQRVLVNNNPFEVVGVMSIKGSEAGGNFPDKQVLLPHRTGMVRVFPAQRNESYGVIEVADSARVQQTQAAVEQLMQQRHGREDYGISNAAARLQAEAATRNTMTMLLSLIAAVSLLVGGIGVMNVMLMTVKERTREIGIRMATGARQRDIQRQFVTESVLVTVTGGITGVALGLAMGGVLLAMQVPIVFSVRAIVGSFACAVVTGLLFGWMPARTAARLNPVEALTGATP
ncbi:ATP-binding cassette domain-containing protein [Lampropedia puyangensis]|uniref:Pyoverdine export ATP-binding/permease protein PvdT n=1 Tax=Lampropedia puyangensis TaxID=1330072 RepID=A0A4S8FBL6_9BURK|nr:ABC transporter permease [Lampropedia puyangensis]THU05068.1 ATP-binding cassette domain-containing protein [Lampropedia puyangensis]